jgi:hypothetical protein
MEILGNCKLCGIHAKLVKSHIIPEWAYKPLYDDDDNHRMLRIVSNHQSPVGFQRSGEWDRFLCDTCEKSFNQLDDYGRAVIYSRPGDPTFGIQTQTAEYGVNIISVDYSRLKLFQLSVLWKAGVCSRAVFSDVNLGKHQSAIRQMLLQKNPGDGIEYGCVMGALMPESGKTLDQVIDRPATFIHDNWTIVRFLFAGCVWLYVLHDDAHNFPLRKYFLTPGAPLPILIGSLNEVPGLIKHLLDLGEVLQQSGQSGRSGTLRS